MLCVAAVTATGVPMRPERRACRADCSPAPRKVSGAPPTRRPRSAASAITLAASSMFMASGFSPYTCLPERRLSSATAACAEGTVRLTTISTSASESTAPRVPDTGTSCSLATVAARSVSRSATATTRTSGKELRLRRYWPLMTPAPTSATPTGPLLKSAPRR